MLSEITFHLYVGSKQQNKQTKQKQLHRYREDDEELKS